MPSVKEFDADVEETLESLSQGLTSGGQHDLRPARSLGESKSELLKYSERACT